MSELNVDFSSTGEFYPDLVHILRNVSNENLICLTSCSNNDSHTTLTYTAGVGTIVSTPFIILCANSNCVNASVSCCCIVSFYIST